MAESDENMSDDMGNGAEVEENVICSTMGEEFSGPSEASPSSHLDHPWLTAEFAPFRYDEADGKWLMFFPRDVIDERWETVKKLYFCGDLKNISSIKISTFFSSSSRFSSSSSTDHVIVFFCGPSEDEAVVMEAGRNLVERFPPKNSVIFYKTNFQTEKDVEKIKTNSATKPSKKWKYRLNYVPPKEVEGGLVQEAASSLDSEVPSPSKTNIPFRSLSETKAKTSGGQPLPSKFSSDGLVMVLDTETTGFPPGAPPEDTDAWTKCRMVELAWHLYTPEGVLLSRNAHLIKPDFDFEIPSGAVKVHGITREKLLSEGSLLQTVFQTFLDQLTGVAVIVGHNIKFDVKVLLAEMHRCGMTNLLKVFEDIPTECTMLMGVAITPAGRRTKLAFLYEECFGVSPPGTMHRADADVEACAKIYFYIRGRGQKQTDKHSGKPIVSSDGHSDKPVVSDKHSDKPVASSNRQSDTPVASSDSDSDTASDSEEMSPSMSEGNSDDDSGSSDEVDRGEEGGEGGKEGGNIFQTNSVAIVLSLAVASTAVFLYSFSL